MSSLSQWYRWPLYATIGVGIAFVHCSRLMKHNFFFSLIHIKVKQKDGFWAGTSSSSGGVIDRGVAGWLITL